MVSVDGGSILLLLEVLVLVHLRLLPSQLCGGAWVLGLRVVGMVGVMFFVMCWVLLRWEFGCRCLLLV